MNIASKMENVVTYSFPPAVLQNKDISAFGKLLAGWLTTKAHDFAFTPSIEEIGRDLGMDEPVVQLCFEELEFHKLIAKEK